MSNGVVLASVCRFAVACCLLGAVGCSRERGDSLAESRAPAERDEQAASDRASGVALESRRQSDDPWFEDVTAQSGVRAVYHNGQEGEQYTLLETVGGGVAMFDYDLDGDLDLFFPGGGAILAGQDGKPARVEGLPGALYRNEGEFRFVDVTGAAGLEDRSLYTHGATALDYNADRWPDLLITGYGGCRLFRNLGDGTFSDETEVAGMTVTGWHTAAAAADFNRDGWPDLYLASYCRWTPQDDQGRFCGDRQRNIRDCCPPQLYPPAQDELLQNLGDGTFQKVTSQAGVQGDGRGLGVVAADLNDDGWIDFYVANDATANHLYLGGPQFPLRETGQIAGVAGNEYGLWEGSMGVDLGDYDQDGRPDLFVTNFEMEDNSLYRHEGEGMFRHASVAAGVAGACFPFVGFGTGFADLNGDGWEDLFVINGSVFYRTGQSPYRQPSFLYENRQGRFHDASEHGGEFFASHHAGRGAAVGDLNNDGAVDLVVTRQNEPAAILRGLKAPQRWAGVRLHGVKGDTLAVGAKITATFQGRTLTRWARSGAGYLSQFDPRIVLPREETENRTVQIRWPSGRVERFDQLTDFAWNELVEGQGRAAPQAGDSPTTVP